MALLYLLASLFASVAALSWLPCPALSGEVRVSDGDTLKIDGERIRLWGMDAPELGQKCKRQGVSYDCGITAREVLISLIGKTRPECEKVNTDRYRRTVARCFVDGEDLGGLMVREGWALDYKRYSKGRYAAEQATARQARRGLWSGEFIPPWEYRHKSP
jgi:endonuclease YncB( thermonuclease family)